jgi:hypothetical protein
MGRLAVFGALLIQLQPAVASFWTVTQYYVEGVSSEKAIETCTTTCRFYSYTYTYQVEPTVTPTASPTSSTTSTSRYETDVAIVKLFLPSGAVPASDMVTTTTYAYTYDTFISYVVPVTYTAPASCPTQFTVETFTSADIPSVVTPLLTPTSTSISTYSTYTWVSLFLATTAVPSSMYTDSSTAYLYSAYVRSCSNPTTTRRGSSPTATGSSSSGSSSSDDDEDFASYFFDRCSSLGGGSCASLATWVIVVASILPTIFVLGFIESYFWFRRMMLGQSALRVGTICWCLLQLWLAFLTRVQKARTPEDQALLRQYWATLPAGTRFKLWFKWGLFTWQYPVELLGNPDGNNPAVAMFAAPPPVMGEKPGGGDDGGSETTQVNQQFQPQPQPQQPAYMPHPTAGGMYAQHPAPAPVQQYQMPPPQGYMNPGQVQTTQPAYLAQFAPAPGLAPPVQQQQQQQPPLQQSFPQHIPSPSPSPANQTDPPTAPSPMHTPPPGMEGQAPPPPHPHPQ